MFDSTLLYQMRPLIAGGSLIALLCILGAFGWLWRQNRTLRAEIADWEQWAEEIEAWQAKIAPSATIPSPARLVADDGHEIDIAAWEMTAWHFT